MAWVVLGLMMLGCVWIIVSLCSAIVLNDQENREMERRVKAREDGEEGW